MAAVMGLTGSLRCGVHKAREGHPRCGVLDAVLIRNAYHEMTEHRAILKGVMSGLKPGALLVIIEGMHDNLLDQPREQQVKEHVIAPGIVETELREAGFDIVDRDDAFTRFPKERTITGGFWMIRARRPVVPAVR